MHPVWFWLAAGLVYAAFLFWYDNWSGPLSPAEVESYMARVAESGEPRDPERLATLRKFLEEDDGGEFFMQNLIRMPAEPVKDPASGELMPARKVLEGYTRRFMPGVFRRAGHPVFAGPALGGYVEAWGVEANPGWTMAGVVRYRSRRDVIELATAPGFGPAHVFKLAAMTHTLAFPVRPSISVLSPRVGMALLLALLAALAQIFFGLRA